MIICLAVVYGGTFEAIVYGGSVETIVYGGSVEAIVYGGTVEAIVYGGTVEAIVYGGTVEAIVYGGTVEAIVYGGTVEAIVYGGSVEAVVYGGSVEAIVYGGSVEAIVYGGSVEAIVYCGPADCDILMSCKYILWRHFDSLASECFHVRSLRFPIVIRLYGPKCPLVPKRLLNLITHSLRLISLLKVVHPWYACISLQINLLNFVKKIKVLISFLVPLLT